MELLLKTDIDPNDTNKCGSTALHRASRCGSNPNCVELLLKNGANVNAADNNGKTALHLASYYGNLKSVEILLKSGANANAANNNGETALHNATGIITTWPDCVELLLKFGANINATDNNGETALHLASLCNSTKCVEILLKNKADSTLEITNGRHKGITAYYLVGKYCGTSSHEKWKKTKVQRVFIKYGIDPDGDENRRVAIINAQLSAALDNMSPAQRQVVCPGRARAQRRTRSPST